MKTIIYSIIAIVFSYGSANAKQLAIVKVKSNVNNYSKTEARSFTEAFLAYHRPGTKVISSEKTNHYLSKHGDSFGTCDQKCMLQVASDLNADELMEVEINQMAGSIYISAIIRMGSDGSIVNQARIEFLDKPDKAAFMLKLTLQKLIGIPTDKTLYQGLTNETMMANTQNPASSQTLNLSGPRLGYSFFSPDLNAVMDRPTYEGGYDINTGIFNFGYQFEKQYLDGGAFQGLVEFIPQIGGLDQGLFIPSLSILNGIRDNRSGIEFGFGPTFVISRKSRMYQENGVWYRPTDRRNVNNLPTTNRPDSRGSAFIDANLVFAAGKSFKVGTMNIPMNVFFVPNKNFYRYGFSLGYNFRR